MRKDVYESWINGMYSRINIYTKDYGDSRKKANVLYRLLNFSYRPNRIKSYEIIKEK